MSDAKKPPQPAAPGAPRTSPGAQAPAQSAARPAPGAPAAARTASGANMRAMTATRAQPLTAAKSDVKVQERLKSEASNALLNAVGAAKDALADFRASNRFFKYKAFIVAGWVGISAATLLIARPGSDGAPDNDLDAKLVVTQTPSGTIYMVKNESEEPWRNVIVEVNKQYKTVARPELQANDGITVTPKILIGADGKLAPASLTYRDLVVRTDEGETQLLENGEVQ